MKTGFIFSAGSFYGLYKKPKAGDFVIAADAGLLLCKKLNIEPNLVVGDFDSMDVPVLSGEILRYPVEKDDTDTMLAIKKAIEFGCEELYIYGGTGGKRMDHSIANIASLAYARFNGCKAYMYDDEFIYTIIYSESIEIPKTVDDGLISVFAFGGDAQGVSIKGAHYLLDNAILHCEFPLGVSNHMLDDVTEISCKKGYLLVSWQLEKAEKDIKNGL